MYADLDKKQAELRVWVYVKYDRTNLLYYKIVTKDVLSKWEQILYRL